MHSDIFGGKFFFYGKLLARHFLFANIKKDGKEANDVNYFSLIKNEKENVECGENRPNEIVMNL